jgi:NADH-quinone oxidoreductase subunit H
VTAVSLLLPVLPVAVDLPWGLIVAIKTGIVLAIIPAGALILGYVFLLKMMSHMQSRLGPMDPGGFHGWFQLIGDGIKFIQKEDIIPAQADRRVFAAAPVVVLISTFLLYIVVPAGPRLVVADLDAGVFYALAVSSLSVIGILMAGWASANKYALLGALRAAAQLIAYELPLVLAVVGVIIQAGTMSLQGIVHFQQDASIFGWGGLGFPLILTQFLGFLIFLIAAQHQGEIFGWDGIGNPFIITQLVGFVIFLVAAQAELTQTPFDMPVAESELVAGYMVEYTGFRFLFFFMGEFGTAFAFAGIASTLFLGGWSVPWVHGTLADVLGPIVLFTKIMLVSFLIFWVRFTYPRFREDQLQAIAWKYLIPLSLVNILATGIFKVVF